MEHGKGGGGAAASAVPKWLPGFLLHDYFTECNEHSHNNNAKSRGGASAFGGSMGAGGAIDHSSVGGVVGCAKKGDRNYYCVDCCEGPLCETGRQVEHPRHYVLQVRKASHTDAIRINDIAKLLDVSHIQTYTINGAKIVFLPSRPQAKPAKGAPRYCEMCHRSLQDQVRFCSLSCKLKALLALPGDASLSLIPKAGWDETAGSGGGDDGTTVTGLSDSLRPASPSPATPAKKRARSTPSKAQTHVHHVEVDGPILRILKLKREGGVGGVGGGDQLPHHSESPTSVLLRHAHSRAADLESSSSHDDHDDDLLDFLSFRKRARKGVPCRAAGVGFVPFEGIYA